MRRIVKKDIVMPLCVTLSIHFLVPPKSHRQIDYAVQDNREHLLYEIILPPKTTRTIELRIHPRTVFATSGLLFGCDSDDGDQLSLDQKPRPRDLVDVYGQGFLPRNLQVNVTEGHRINARRQYRWSRNLTWNASSTIIIGIQIDTKNIGSYVWRVVFLGEDFETTKFLKMRVEEQKYQTMKCANGDHERHMVAPIL